MGFVLSRKNDITKSIGFGLCFAFLINVVELELMEWLGRRIINDRTSFWLLYKEIMEGSKC